MKDDRLIPEVSLFRACSAGETFDKVSPFLSRLGITRVASQTGLDRVGIPVWCAYTPNAKSIVIAQGKGLDDASARTSAVMEGIERAVATQPVCEVVTQSRAALHATHCATHVLDCLLATRSLPIAPDEKIVWARGLNLNDRSDIWLPFEAIAFDRTTIGPRFWLSSDGLASGNTREEAILHGLLERVERDALALWTVTNIDSRFAARLDPDSLRDGELREMLAKIDAADLQIALFDITSDLGISCISALLGPKRLHAHQFLRHVDITLGAGASHFPAVAASRAISEAIQSRMTFIAGARDDLLPEAYKRPADRAICQAFSMPATRSLDDMPALFANNTADGLQTLVNYLSDHGIDELFSIDISPEWLPVHVAKVLAPQLENPDGNRRQRFGHRALSRSLQ